MIDAVELEGLEAAAFDITSNRLYTGYLKGINTEQDIREYHFAVGLGGIAGMGGSMVLLGAGRVAWWAAGNPQAAGELALEMVNPSAVGAFGVGAMGFADEVIDAVKASDDVSRGLRALDWKDPSSIEGIAGTTFKLQRELTNTEMAVLAKQYGVEFAQTETQGIFSLHSGGKSYLPLPNLSEIDRIVSHTHPTGNVGASGMATDGAGFGETDVLRELGQRTSLIISPESNYIGVYSEYGTFRIFRDNLETGPSETRLLDIIPRINQAIDSSTP